MRQRGPFLPDDLQDLDTRLYKQASSIVTMRAVATGLTDTTAIGLRHDVDDNPGSLAAACRFAAWEADRGYRSSYYFLHTAGYFWHHEFGRIVTFVHDLGHEVGLHINCIAQAITTGRHPISILEEALFHLRQFVPVRSVVAHGDRLCHKYAFVNDEMFEESIRRDDYDRTVAGVTLQPVPRDWFGIQFDPNWLPRAAYLSDSGHVWSQPFEQVVDEFPYQAGQLHMLVHPDWWTQAFVEEQVAA